MSWIHGLGYQPHVALWEDPLALRLKMERLGIQFSQLDAAFPLSRPEGATPGRRIHAAHDALGAHRGLSRASTPPTTACAPAMTDREALDHMRRIYTQIVRVAETYGIVINIEPHGYFTTKPEFMEEMLSFVDSPYLGMNMDTGNTFIAGQDPVAFLEKFKSG